MPVEENVAPLMVSTSGELAEIMLSMMPFALSKYAASSFAALTMSIAVILPPDTVTSTDTVPPKPSPLPVYVPSA